MGVARADHILHCPFTETTYSGNNILHVVVCKSRSRPGVFSWSVTLFAPIQYQLSGKFSSSFRQGLCLLFVSFQTRFARSFLQFFFLLSVGPCGLVVCDP